MNELFVVQCYITCNFRKFIIRFTYIFVNDCTKQTNKKVEGTTEEEKPTDYRLQDKVNPVGLNQIIFLLNAFHLRCSSLWWII